ncbi:MAG: N-6 DNA methylase [Ignavibacteria bacterium]|nr:N-6 DNA methylase [Ignavibacteria bacterium]
MANQKSLEEVQNIVEKYLKVQKEKRAIKYNEEMTKKDFILPLFRALGWNTEDSTEVTAEEKISRGRVDYGFRINGIPKFFLEAKPLRADIQNPSFAMQAINYAWHKGCTWAVLTNFATIMVFNAEWKAENIIQSHFKTIEVDDFIINFDELWLLSRKSFETGLIDKVAERWGKKTKKIPVDKQLLQDFTHFREILTKSVYKHNAELNLNEEELDEAVQRILDRLIFIRNCEDRELEERKLLPALNNWKSSERSKPLFLSLRKIFEEFNNTYNSKIFSPHLCDQLKIEDSILAEIINGLHYSKDKSITYDFANIEADVLGNIYEQYLSHILKKTQKRTKLTVSQAHRKEQGIYYTPTYIVDYIVRNTLGEILKNKKPEEVEKLRILDPACGSGSFLIKAFDVLNEYYSQHDKSYDQTEMDFSTGLHFDRKVKILMNNIFGVDLDKQAVEISQLNLLLKIAERGQRLPLLQNNIKCGNSLIDDPEIARERAFKWEEEFKEIMDEGGFDVVIGNPPYSTIGSKDPLQNLRFYYKLSKGVINSAALFLKRSYDLLKQNGCLGFIIPKSFLYVNSWYKIRQFLLQNSQILEILDVSKAFKDVRLEQVIIIIKKCHPNLDKPVVLKTLTNSRKALENKIEQKEIINHSMFVFDPKIRSIYNKLTQQSVFLGEISENFRGIGIQKLCKSNNYEKNLVPVIGGKQVDRYIIKGTFCYVNPTELNKFLKKINKFKGPRILAQNIVAHIKDHIRITCTYEHTGLLVLDTVNNIKIYDTNFNIKYILSLLNSKLISFYAYYFIYFRAIRTMHFDNKYSSRIPIKKLHLDDQTPLIFLADRMLDLNRKLNEIGVKFTDERLKIEEEIRSIDEQIDRLVYQIYGLTEEEIRIIEDNFK